MYPDRVVSGLRYVGAMYLGQYEQKPMCERIQQYLEDTSLVRAIVADGCDHARKLTHEIMREVREVMGVSYS